MLDKINIHKTCRRKYTSSCLFWLKINKREFIVTDTRNLKTKIVAWLDVALQTVVLQALRKYRTNFFSRYTLVKNCTFFLHVTRSTLDLLSTKIHDVNIQPIDKNFEDKCYVTKYRSRRNGQVTEISVSECYLWKVKKAWASFSPSAWPAVCNRMQNDSYR